MDSFWIRLLLIQFMCLLAASCGHLNAIGEKSDDTRPAPQRDEAVALAQLDDSEFKFLEIINGYRIENKLAPLIANQNLNEAAHWHSSDMAQKNYFSHTDSLNRSPFDRMRFFGYVNARAMAENVAGGFADAQPTFEQWKNSSGHNGNMLGDFTEIGIARAHDKDSKFRWYWTTNFGKPAL